MNVTNVIDTINNKMKEVDLKISEINSKFQFYAILDGIDKRELYSGYLGEYNKEVNHCAKILPNIMESEKI